MRSRGRWTDINKHCQAEALEVPSWRALPGDVALVKLRAALCRHAACGEGEETD